MLGLILIWNINKELSQWNQRAMYATNGIIADSSCIISSRHMVLQADVTSVELSISYIGTIFVCPTLTRSALYPRLIEWFSANQAVYTGLFGNFVAFLSRPFALFRLAVFIVLVCRFRLYGELVSISLTLHRLLLLQERVGKGDISRIVHFGPSSDCISMSRFTAGSSTRDGLVSSCSVVMSDTICTK